MSREKLSKKTGAKPGPHGCLVSWNLEKERGHKRKSLLRSDTKAWK
jgi:hypothetical protein